MTGAVTKPLAEPTVPGARLLRSQRARRARVLDAVVELAHEGGYDAIQLRPVSERSGVGTDTIYRYFGSRDQLISTAVSIWVEREFLERAPTWPQGDTPVERLLELYKSSWRVWEPQLNMMETFVRAALAEGNQEAGLARRGLHTFDAITEAILADVDPDFRKDALTLMSHVYHSLMTFVMRGQLAPSDVYDELERATRRLAQHPAMAAHRPRSWDYDPPKD